MKKKRFIIYSVLLILLLAFAVSAMLYPIIRQKYLDSELLEAVSHFDTQRARFLLKAGANANARDNNGETALMKVTNNIFDIGIVKSLLENGAEVNEKNSYGQTPLMYAVDPLGAMDEIWYDVVDLLLENGADVNATDNRGNTALIYILESICHRTDDDVSNIARLLVKHGADVNIMDEDGCRALDRAGGVLREFFLDAGAIPGEECPDFICV